MTWLDFKRHRLRSEMIRLDYALLRFSGLCTLEARRLRNERDEVSRQLTELDRIAGELNQNG